MKILEGQLPEQRKEWFVLLGRTPDAPLAHTWDLSVLLAKAGGGSIILVMVIDEDSEQQRAAARAAIERAEADVDDQCGFYAVITTRDSYGDGTNNFVRMYNVDILVDDISDPIHHDLEKSICAVVAVRGDTTGFSEDDDGIQSILVPTSGGPNSTYALSTLLPLTPEIKVTALYVVPDYLGADEEALGRDRLRETIEFVDGEGRIDTDLIVAPTISQGIREAAKDYDLVLTGASAESSVDKMLFGNIPDEVVRESKKPVALMREPHDPVAHFMSGVTWRLQRVIPRLKLSDRAETYVRIRRGARPNLDFFVLISLSAIIAALGLIVNSAAVVIGAMLVAPLMSPIVGSGLAMVLGNVRFLRLSIGAVARGAALALVLGAVIGLFQIGKPLTPELLARTQPSIIDLLIALFSGIAAAYALSKSTAAAALPGVAIAAALVPPLATSGVVFTAGYYVESLGALLLFVTNFIAITIGSAVVFLVLGFRPTRAVKERKEVRQRSVLVALVSLALVSLILVTTTYLLNEKSRDEARIREVTEEQLLEVTGAKLGEVRIVSFENRHLALEVVARSTKQISYQEVRDLQEAIGEQLVADGIINDIELAMTVILVTELDPLTPPTPTPGPSPTPEPTPIVEEAAGG
ncbi:MAG: TIGR00341 family protein [Candidatus Promineifilaceae bacterium]